MLECVINVSEGRDDALLRSLSSSVATSLIDLHADKYHNRSVFTLAGMRVIEDAIALTYSAVTSLNLEQHSGAHPRIGVVDVVPFVPLGASGLEYPLQLEEALSARNQFASIVSANLDLPCFLYGPERSLPDIRRSAFGLLQPDFGPHQPNLHAGACCVGARGALIAYNVNITGVSHDETKSIAGRIRMPGLRSLGFDLNGNMQISCNITDPLRLGIDVVYDIISNEVARSGGKIRDAELVGLVPKIVYDNIDPSRRELLGLSASSTIESRLA